VRKAGEIITALFRDRFGPEFMETAKSTAGLFNSWADVVTELWPRPFDEELGKAGQDAPAVSVHSRIRELERGVLLVEADHPGWIQILQTKQAELLAVVQRRYPEMGIRGIAFRLSREPIPVQVPRDPVLPIKEEQSYQSKDGEPALEYSESQKLPGDEEFYRALKGLEESIKARNKERSKA